MKRKVLSIVICKCRSCNVYWLRNHTNNSSACDCTSTAPQSGGSQGEEEIVLRWALWDYDTTPYWKALVDTYKVKPNVTIEHTDLGSADYSPF